MPGLLRDELLELTTTAEVDRVERLCNVIHAERGPAIATAFFEELHRARTARPEALRQRDEALPADWYTEPLYYAYVQYFATPAGRDRATFEDLTRALDHLERLGTPNLYLLPHYESPMGDHGFDVSDFVPRASLGGAAGFRDFMNVATARGFRVITDLPINHVSIEHRWFRDVLAGDVARREWFLARDRPYARVERVCRDSEHWVRYIDEDGTVTERLLIFPDVDQSHHLEVEIDGRPWWFYREFYPFQVDLDLTHPDVLRAVLRLLGEELNLGVLGKRTDAVAHWIKRPGTTADGLPETHAVHELIKRFVRGVSTRAIIVPEVVRSAVESARYCGTTTTIGSASAPSEGDALFCFELQGALREMIYFQTSAAFWHRIFNLPELPRGAVWLNLLEHHDETYMGFISDANRRWLAGYIEQKGGRVYKSGMSAGGRYADCLDEDPRRIAMALFCLYLVPGTPAIYYGVEVGMTNQYEHAERMRDEQHQLFTRLGMDVAATRVFDPRELQRGPLSAVRLEACWKDGYPGLHVVASMNRLRREHAALRSSLLTPIDNGHDGVLSLVRFADGESSSLLALVNLTGNPKKCRLPLGQLRARLALPEGRVPSLEPLLEGEPCATIVPGRGEALAIELPPYHYLLATAG